MLTKRIIPCLDIKDGRTVKGTKFVNLKDAGDPVELAIKYCELGADELVFLDISATNEKRKTVIDLVSRVGKKINIPFTVGGGINSIETVGELLSHGADKVSINSAAIRNPALIHDIAYRYGSQCLVVAIDAKYENDKWIVYTKGGKNKTEYELFDWAKIAVESGCGEILFTSMDHDGTKDGYAIEALEKLSNSISIPVIASGGAGSKANFLDLFQKTRVSAALAASIFHFDEINLKDLKNYLKNNEISIRTYGEDKF